MGGMSDTDEGSMSEVEVPGTLNSELRTSDRAFPARLARHAPRCVVLTDFSASC